MRFSFSVCLAGLASLAVATPTYQAIAARQATGSTVPAPLPPPRDNDPPQFTHLYTAYADVLNPIFYGQTPLGIRTTLPCVGGNFSGPYFSGTIYDSGADFGLYDPQNGQFTALTRYNLLTTTGATIIVSTKGSQVGGPYGNVHVHVDLETGDRDLYWINHASVIGMVDLFDFTDIGFTLRLTTWHRTTDLVNGTFLNGTAY